MVWLYAVNPLSMMSGPWALIPLGHDPSQTRYFYAGHGKIVCFAPFLYGISFLGTHLLRCDPFLFQRCFSLRHRVCLQATWLWNIATLRSNSLSQIIAPRKTAPSVIRAACQRTLNLTKDTAPKNPHPSTIQKSAMHHEGYTSQQIHWREEAITSWTMRHRAMFNREYKALKIPLVSADSMKRLPGSLTSSDANRKLCEKKVYLHLDFCWSGPKFGVGSGVPTSSYKITKQVSEGGNAPCQHHDIQRSRLPMGTCSSHVIKIQRKRRKTAYAHRKSAHSILRNIYDRKPFALLFYALKASHRHQACLQSMLCPMQAFGWQNFPQESMCLHLLTANSWYKWGI